MKRNILIVLLILAVVVALVFPVLFAAIVVLLMFSPVAIVAMAIRQRIRLTVSLIFAVVIAIATSVAVLSTYLVWAYEGYSISGDDMRLQEIPGKDLLPALEPLNGAQHLRFRYFGQIRMIYWRLELTGKIDEDALNRLLSKNRDLRSKLNLTKPSGLVVNTIDFFDPDVIENWPERNLEISGNIGKMAINLIYLPDTKEFWAWIGPRGGEGKEMHRRRQN